MITPGEFRRSLTDTSLRSVSRGRLAAPGEAGRRPASPSLPLRAPVPLRGTRLTPRRWRALLATDPRCPLAAVTTNRHDRRVSARARSRGMRTRDTTDRSKLLGPLAKAESAFANTGGGSFIIGIEEDG